MLDDLADFVIAATLDVGVEKAGRKRRWVRIVRAVLGLLFLAMIAAAIYVTIRYS
jgi:hypothetical protein